MEKFNLTPPLRNAILAQCFGGHIELILTGGFLFTYFTSLGYSSENALLLLALPGWVRFVAPPVAAYLSDRTGRKRWSLFGLVVSTAGILMLAPAASVAPPLRNLFLLLGLSLYSIGYCFFTTNWFAILSSHLARNVRGRFFGILRVSWQLVGIAVTSTITLVLRKNDSLVVFQLLLLGLTLFLILRIFFFTKIPEGEPLLRPQGGGRRSIMETLTLPRFLPFNAYVFLLTLFTAAAPMLFNVLEKEALGFSKDRIVFFGNLLLMGSLAGYFLGGRLVDRHGTKLVFLVCHFAYGGIFFLVAARIWAPLPIPVWLGLLTALFGFVQAAASIAVTTELLGLIPAENRSMAVAFNISLIGAAALLGVIVPVQAVKSGMLSGSWKLFSGTLSNYDTIFLGCGTMVLLLVVTLGLIPSVIGKAQSRSGDVP